uniref:Notum n=1 Tax=Platynereis dumerilii TaxID=6359 RepID=A0A1B1M0N4_PLADU|nr:notum [Platynereis dumerilii]
MALTLKIMLLTFTWAVVNTNRGNGNLQIDLEQLQRMGIDTSQLLEQLMAAANCGVREPSHMGRHWLSNDTVTCNDGSKAGYYMRTSHGSKRWLVFLEGGWFCFDRGSCRGRWLNTPHLMTSGHWPDRRTGSGILSWDPSENPYLFNANMVYIPYCSSDSWSGTHKSTTKGDFSFMGALILEEVIKDLVSSHGLRDADKLFLAGTSAGGTGVLVNLDHTAGVMAKLAPLVEVRGIADSGWFLDNEQYKKALCSDAHSCSPTESIRRGYLQWHGRVPESCKKNYDPNEHWRCYFGYRIYPNLKTPIFVIQHLFDEAQITADNVGPPVRKEQWQYIHNMGQDMKRTLFNVSAVFAPACLSHIILTRKEWHRLSISGVSLPKAIHCWESSAHETNHYSGSRKSRQEVHVHRLITGESRSRRGRDRYQGDDPVPKSEKQKKRKKRRRRKNKKEREEMSLETVSKPPEEQQNKGSEDSPIRSTKEERRQRRREERRRRRRQEREERKRLRRQRRREEREKTNREREEQVRAAREVMDQSRNRRSVLLFDEHDIHHMEHHDNQCNHHKLDHCAWPQCNLHCPKIHNPFTGEEMDFIDLLLQFGLDLSSIANALGMDVPTLQSMDHDTLLNLLTQSK